MILPAHLRRLLSRSMAAKPLITLPAPHPLPPEQQREFELLQRKAEAMANAPPGRVERHPDAPAPLKAEFDGDINPATGERGGPKREPVRRWTEEEGRSYAVTVKSDTAVHRPSSCQTASTCTHCIPISNSTERYLTV